MVMNFRQSGRIASPILIFQKELSMNPSIPPKSDRLDLVRHSTAHILASAVIKLYPGTKVAIGPSIDNGFYYDFQLPKPISPDDLGGN